MRFTPRTWSLLSIMLFVAAVFFWLKGNEYQERRKQQAPAVAPVATNEGTAMDLLSPGTAGMRLAALEVPGTPGLPHQYRTTDDADEASSSNAIAETDSRHPFRLKNTGRPIDELVRDERAILMANAFIDTAGADLAVPEHLRSEVDPGSYIVQWNDAPDARFRSILGGMDAQIISYVPNNAYLVRLGGDKADELRAVPGVAAVLPYEPYYKLDARLLQAAVEQSPLPPSLDLRVTFFPDGRENGLAAVRSLHAQVLAEEGSPFGPQAIIRPPVNGLADLAQLDSVQAIEPVFPRKLANDLTRVTVGVSPDPVTNHNYMNLSGSNIWVNVNDTGIDPEHGDLQGRVTLGHPSLDVDDDSNGHGTFVAAIIAGSGEESDTVDFVPGSFDESNYRGMAPEAQIFALPLQNGEDVYPHVLDSYLYETAARTNYVALNRTNTLISNNSWTYLGAAEYDSSAARFDAAVRDSIPGLTGEQPVLFIFAAGNGGFGDEDGFGGQPDGVFAPATAKNVITVGALEHPRFIEIGYTNQIVVTNNPGPDQIVITNEEIVFPYFDLTDSGDQVASYSSRGNVGIGTEGFFGRFKPDLVAPGTMIVSAKSAGFDLSDHLDTTNEPGRTFEMLHDDLSEYRIDSGTTYAAPVVSGLLALIQEFYQYHAPTELRRDFLSPALMKAILINGARSHTANYDLQVRSLVNYQGWGLPNIQKSLPTNLVVADEEKWSMRVVDQHPTNALATGHSRTWNVTLTTNASAYPLRATLVWTDPPGNPNVAVKLVNDLDLVITNLESGVVFYGNNIPGGSDFTQGLDPADSDDFDPAVYLDTVNNVENVIILDPSNFGREFSVTVRAKRVNVNSVNNYLDETGNTNDVVQDFALVVSSDIDLEDEDVFEEFAAEVVELPTTLAPLTIITNGLPLLEQRVGASASLVGTNGVTNQWSFYVFTNIYIENDFVNITNGSNVAFVTFNPPELARPRNFEADVDIYVSKDPQLTNLVPRVMSSAFKSISREGTEMVVFTNATVGADSVYYIGVKAEDQQGAEFSLIGLSSVLPFDEEDNGNRIIRGLPFSSFIPDGSPRRPGGNMVMGIGLTDKRVQRITVTNTISHENVGDLVGVLSHGNTDVVLNNHNLSGGIFFGTNTYVYDDFFLPELGTTRSDGPGSLNSFAGQKIVGPWMLQMIDNAPGFTGRVELLTLKIQPLRDDLIPGVSVHVEIGASNIVYYPVDVPPGVTNVIFEISNLTGGTMLEAFLRRDLLPTFTEYDLKATNTPPADGFTFSYPTRTSPPLVAGTYFLGLYNPGGTPIEFDLLMLFEYGFDPNNESRSTLGEFDLRDNATTNVVLDLTADKVVTSAEVGLRLDHPRLADTVLHLVSPQGTRVLLSENRGLNTELGFGTTFVITNASNNFTTNYGYTYFTEDTNLAQVPIKFAPLPFNSLPDDFGLIFTNGFEGPVAGNYNAASTIVGWTVGGTQRVVNGQTILPRVSIISGTNYAHSGTNLLSLGTGSVRRNLALEEGKSYQLRFSYRTSEPFNLMSTGLDRDGDPLDAGEVDPHYLLFSSPHPDFPGPDAYVVDPRNSPRVFSHWAFNTDESQWIAPYPTYISVEPGTYVFRAYLSLYGLDTRTAQVRFKWSADDFGEALLGNSIQSTNPIPPFLFHQQTNVVTVSGFQQGLNILDFDVQDTNLVTGLRVEVLEALPDRDLSESSFTVDFNGQTQTLRSGNGWTTRTINFVALSDLETLEFRSGDGEVWIDSVELIGTGDSFVLPEESLAVLEGERAYGEWELEITDGRTGAVIPNPEMLRWKLNLTFAEPFVYAEHLRSGVTYPTRVTQAQRPGIRPGILLTNHVHYFVVETCPDTTEARITLTGITNVGNIQLWVDHNGFPTMDPDRDDYVMVRNFDNATTGNGVAEFLINTESPAAAPLRPGKPLFVAVRNVSRNQTNRYTLRATLDVATCQGTRQATTELENNETVVSTLAANEPTESEGELFEVEVEEGDSALAFNVEADGDASFVVQKGMPPTRADHQFSQDTPGSGSETLVVPTESLTPGKWYILVLNNDTRPITYQITASMDAGDEAPIVTARLLGDELVLEWQAEAGSDYRIESSADLSEWDTVTTITVSGSVGTYSASVSGSDARFFRVARLP